MAILRGLSSRLLPCGCLAGVYETYEGEIVTILDARGLACKNSAHVDGDSLPEDSADVRNHAPEAASERR
jgi:hypothetical protein